MAALFGTLLTILALVAAIPASGQKPPGTAPTATDWLASDKPVHVLAAYIAAGSGYAAGIETGWEPADRRRAAIATAVAASLAKEAFDVGVQGERWSWKDLGADAVGILLFVGLTLAAER